MLLGTGFCFSVEHIWGMIVVPVLGLYFVVNLFSQKTLNHTDFTEITIFRTFWWPAVYHSVTDKIIIRGKHQQSSLQARLFRNQGLKMQNLTTLKISGQHRKDTKPWESSHHLNLYHPRLRHVCHVSRQASRRLGRVDSRSVLPWIFFEFLRSS